jgi:hypothetical protein
MAVTTSPALSATPGTEISAAPPWSRTSTVAVSGTLIGTVGKQSIPSGQQSERS